VDLGILPKSLVVVVIGTALAWIDGVQTIENLENAADLVKPYGLSTGFSAFDSFSTLSDTIGTVLPVAFAAASGTLMNVISAKKAGDSYGPVETMVSDGVGTIIAAFFGTPFGTSVYIGHPAYKKMGAGIAYSIVNCVVYFFFAIFGVFSVCAGLIPQLAVAPLLLFVGLTITQEAFESGPVRHYPGIVFGLIPSVVDLMITNGANVSYGFLALQPAAILLSTVFAAIAIYCTDRKFLAAAGWSVGASILSFIGLLHQQFGATLEEFKAAPFNGTEANTPWRYSVAWLTVAGFMMIMFALQKVGKVEPEIEDEEVDQEDSAKVDAY
jgi:AGZA family xanthine/uracil permease-like MFS transporter